MRKVFLFLFAFHTITSFCQQPRLVLPIGHHSWIRKVSISPRDKYTITVADDNTIKVWDYKGGFLLRELKGFFADAIFNDQATLIVAAMDTSVAIWDFFNGTLQKQFKAHDAAITSIRYSKDYSLVITTSVDKTVKVWDAVTWQLKKNLGFHNGFVYAADISSGNRLVATGSHDEKVRVWDAETGELIKSFHEHSRELWSVQFTQNSEYLMGASADGQVVIWQVDTWEPVLQINTGTILNTAVFGGGDSTIIINNYDEVRIYNFPDGKLVKAFRAHTDGIENFCLAEQGKKLISVSRDRQANIWNTSSWKLERQLKGYCHELVDVAYSPASKLVSMAADDGKVFTWSFDKAVNMLTHIYPPSFRTPQITFTNSGKRLLVTGEAGNIRILDSYSGELLHELESHGPAAVVTKNEQQLLYGWSNGFVRVQPLTSRQQPDSFRAHKSGIQAMALSNTNKLLFTADSEDSVRLWQMPSKKRLFSLQGSNKTIEHCGFSPDEKQVFGLDYHGRLAIWSTVTGKELHSFRLDGGILSAEFHSSANLILLAASEGAVVLDLSTGKTVQQFTGHAGGVRAATFVNNEKFVLTVARDNTAKLWNANTGKEICSFIPVSNTDFMILLPDGYYMASANAAKLLHYVTPDLQVITFEQLDTRYNRPDKVLQALGYADTGLIQSYKRAYEKRIQKLKIDTSLFSGNYSVPRTVITNSEAISFEHKTSSLRLQIHGADSSYALDRFNIWINEVPVFGSGGIKLNGATKSFDTSLSVTLSQGENRIEASLTNINGIESYRTPVVVYSAPLTPVKEKLYFIGIGIEKFANPGYDLTWTVKDIKDIASKLKQRYPEVIIDTLFNSSVTKTNILHLRQKLLQLEEDDKLVISYSGHGILSDQLDYYLSTYDITFEAPERAGLPYQELEALVDSIRPRKKLVFLDACHSGELDKEEIARIEASRKKLESTGIHTKSNIKIMEKKRLGAANSFELMQDLFVNVSRGTGATIIAAAGGLQYAQERGDLKNGVFTYCLIEAFNTHANLTVSQLKKLVCDGVTRITNGLQKPVSRNQTNRFDWVIWQ